MLTAFSQTELVERARDAGVMAYIVKPFTAGDVTPAIDIALSRWGEMKTLEAEVADLGDRLETRKAVDRAKGVLMTKLKITEADAFRWIQKTAMDRRMGMREVAEAVIAGMEKA
jgi:response regulator NasT